MDTRDRHPPLPACPACSLSSVVGWLLIARPRRPPDRPRARGWVGLGIVFEFDNKPGKYPNSIEREDLYDDSTGVMDLDIQTHTRQSRTCHL